MPNDSEGFSRERFADETAYRLTSILTYGNWSDAARIFGNDWAEKFGSDSRVRVCAVDGIFRNIRNGSTEGNASVQNALALDATDFQKPGAQTSAARCVLDLLRNGRLSELAEVERLAHLGPKHYSDKIRMPGEVENAIKAAIAAGRSPDAIYADLSPLPFPDDFNVREKILAADRQNRLGILLSGHQAALKIFHERALTPQERADRAFQDAIQEGADRAIRFATPDVLFGYHRLFGVDLKEVPWTAVLQGYCGLVRQNRLVEAAVLLRKCPQLTDDLRRGPELTNAVVLGTATLASNGNFADAERLIQFGKLSHDKYEEAVLFSIDNLIQNNNGRVLAEMIERWRVPTALVRKQGANIVRIHAKSMRPATMEMSWAKAKEVQSLSRLPRKEFYDAFGAGVVEMANRLGYEIGVNGVDLASRVEEIKAVRLRLPIEPEIADQIEARASVAFVTKLFQHGRAEFLDTARHEFPSLNKETIRRAAVDGIRNILRGPGKSLDRIVWANQWLARNAMSEVRWDDLRDDARTFAETQLRSHGQAFFDLFPAVLSIPEAELASLLDETRDDVRRDILSDKACDPARTRRYFDLYGFSWQTFPLKDIPLPYLLETQDPELLERAKSDPWLSSLASLRGLQARAANPKYDPWILELFPMVDRLSREENVLDRESEKDGKLLVEYVSHFGMFDLPKISRIFFRLKKGSFSSLSESEQADLVELIGPKAARLESPHLIHEIRKLRFDFQKELLQDRVPRKIGTTLGEEAFAAVRGRSEWSSSDRPSDLFALWQQTVDAARPKIVRLEQEAIRAIADQDDAAAESYYARADAEREKISVAPGYEETTFAVARTYRGKDGATSAEEEIERLISEAPEYELQELRDAGETTMFAARCPEWLAMSNESKSYANKDPIYELRERMSEAGRYAPGISVPTESETESFFRPGGNDVLIAMMEEIAARANDPSLDRFLLALSAIHVANVAPATWTRQFARNQFDGTETEARERATFLSQYLKEHYLNPVQDPKHTGHASFSERLLRTLERAWHAEGNAKTNPILRTNAEFEAVRAKQTRLSTETVDVTLVPVRGPLAIYSGDIASACYSEEHKQIAQGEVPGIRPMIFVTNRNKPSERLAGSVLFVETFSPKDGRVLVIRANNPRENLIAQVDTASLIRKTVDAAIATARRRKIRRVTIIRDEATQASSNRTAVSGFYQKEWKEAETIGLVDEPETNFHTYDIWNEHGDHPAVVVWTNDDPEAT